MKQCEKIKIKIVFFYNFSLAKEKDNIEENHFFIGRAKEKLIILLRWKFIYR